MLPRAIARGEKRIEFTFNSFPVAALDIILNKRFLNGALSILSQLLPGLNFIGPREAAERLSILSQLLLTLGLPAGAYGG